MSTAIRLQPAPKVEYPESDGLPMADNTRQFRWLTMIKGGLDIVFDDEPNVFVAGDLLWYPVEGNNTTCVAPDVMVAFGRPKGDRGSYLQWLEDNIAPQVVFEILSPGNRPLEIARKVLFYERYAVEEFYIYDPDSGELSGWHRAGGKWQEFGNLSGWVSPRLNVKFELKDGELEMYMPDGRRFSTVVEIERARKLAESRVQEATRQAEEARRMVEQLAAQLRSLGVEPKLDNSGG